MPSVNPQGSEPRPTLFYTFIKDLAKSLSNPCHLFTDDVKVVGVHLEEDIEAATA